MTRGGLGLTHSVDIVTRMLYKGYCLIPFMEELRVMTDWTATRTSLDFFMWMKLEDAQQSLYRTKVDMETRGEPGEPQPLWWKSLQGGVCICALFCVLVGPLGFF